MRVYTLQGVQAVLPSGEGTAYVFCKNFQAGLTRGRLCHARADGYIFYGDGSDLTRAIWIDDLGLVPSFADANCVIGDVPAMQVRSRTQAQCYWSNPNSLRSGTARLGLQLCDGVKFVPHFEYTEHDVSTERPASLQIRNDNQLFCHYLGTGLPFRHVSVDPPRQRYDRADDVYFDNDQVLIGHSDTPSETDAVEAGQDVHVKVTVYNPESGQLRTDPVTDVAWMDQYLGTKIVSAGLLFSVVRTTPHGSHGPARAGFLTAQEYILVRPDGTKVPLTLQNNHDRIFDVRPLDLLTAGVTPDVRGHNVLTVGSNRYDFHKRGKIRGARFAPDGLSLWFWTNKNLYAMDLDV